MLKEFIVQKIFLKMDFYSFCEFYIQALNKTCHNLLNVHFKSFKEFLNKLLTETLFNCFRLLYLFKLKDYCLRKLRIIEFVKS